VKRLCEEYAPNDHKANLGADGNRFVYPGGYEWIAQLRKGRLISDRRRKREAIAGSLDSGRGLRTRRVIRIRSGCHEEA
jgi:hypothetical protein